MLPKLTVVIGAARSGKSGFAERLVCAGGRKRVYLATAQSFDSEMQARILRHREMRGDGWRTVEEPCDAAAVLAKAGADEIVLFDCATLWLSNHLLADHDIAAETATLLVALRSCAAPVVIVSGEVGAGIVPDNALSRRFRDEQGQLNQRLAAEAGLVVTVIAGLPLVLKGSLKGLAP